MMSKNERVPCRALAPVQSAEDLAERLHDGGGFSISGPEFNTLLGRGPGAIVTMFKRRLPRPHRIRATLSPARVARVPGGPSVSTAAVRCHATGGNSFESVSAALDPVADLGRRNCCGLELAEVVSGYRFTVKGDERRFLSAVGIPILVGLTG